MKKTCKIDSWFKKKPSTIENAPASDVPTTSDVLITEVPCVPETLASDDPPRKFQRINEVDITSLERDPGLRPSIWDYSANLQDEIRRAYIKLGPYQPIFQKYPKSGPASHQRCFQESYFKLYPSWLEYSPHKDAVFCLPCYLFSSPSGNSGQNAFMSEGFRNWRKVSVSGESCLFKQHMGSKVNSCHKICQAKCDALMNQSTHIVPAFEGFTSQQKASNRLRVKATVDTIRWLIYQGCALRGHDESIDSANRGNLHEMLGLIRLYNDGSNLSQRGEARAAYKSLISFEFIFILHMMQKILEITNFLCVTLQSQSQDILNAMHVVSSTKEFLQKLRDEGFDSILTSAGAFCRARNIDVPNMEALYLAREGRARHQHENFTIGHYYRIDIFYAAIDSQLQELNTRFNEKSMELLMLSSSLDPRVGHVKIDDVCELVHKFYPQDFTEQEKAEFEMQLRYYVNGVVQLAEYKELSSVSELCQWLVRTKKSTIYPLVFRVIVLILTLPVSTATSERSFSAMKVLKTRLRSKMEDNFLSDSLLMYIEKEIADNISTDSIVDDFRDMKERRVPF